MRDMKKLILFGFVAASAFCQRIPQINLYNGDPTGLACHPENSIVQSTTTGSIYTCHLGIWVSGGGPPGPPGPPGSGNITASPQFSLFYQPNVGTQSLAQGDPNITTDGSGNVTGVSLKAKAIGGQRYSAPYGGLLSAMAANQNVITDPTDVTTSTSYSFTNIPANVPSPFAWTDTRSGMTQNFYHNFPYPRNATFSREAAGNVTNCLLDAPYTGAGTALYSCGQINSVDNGPGVSIGNPAVAPVGGIQWQVGKGLDLSYTSAGAGIREALNTVTLHTGIGDTAVSDSISSHGGMRAASDEATTRDIIVNEDTSQFRGSCASGCTTGSQAVSTTPTSFEGSQGVRCCIIDTTVGPTANTITNLAAGLSGTLEAVTFGTAVTVSNFWGTLSADVQPQSADLPQPPYGTVVTFNVAATSGVPVITTKMCFASQFHDVITPTAVTGSGPYTITALVRKPHASGSVIMQGGECGTGLELLANTPSGANPNRYLADIIGCVSTTICEVTFFRLGGGSRTPFLGNGGNFSPTIYASGTTTGLTSNGTTVYATGVTGFPLTWNKGTVLFSGASDGTLNTFCTGVTFVTNVYTSFTCTNAGLTGTHTATTSTFVPSTATTALNSVNIWPMAEVLDVQTYNSTTCTALNLAPVCVRGDFALEPNIIQFATSDSLTETNDEAGGYTVKINSAAQNPWSLYHGLAVGIGGTGAQGGGASVIDNTAFVITNGQSNVLYTDNGGSVSPPNAAIMTGSYFDLWTTNEGPSNGGSMDFIGLTANQKNNPNYLFTISSTSALSGALMLDTVIPFLGDRNILEPGLLGLGGTAGGVQFNTAVNGATFNDRIAFAAVTPPTCTVTQGPGTGTLADGTYYYRIAARNSASGGPGIPAAECNGAVANGGANSVQVKWNRAVGADIAYYIYGRSTGAELQMTNVGSTVLSFVDDGSITPSGAIPTTDLTRGFVDQAAKLCANSSGTAFEACLTAPASAGASYVVTLPSVAGTLPITIGSGTATMTTALITGPACGTTVTVAATGVLATDVIGWSFSAAPAGTNAGLVSWPTAGNVNFAYCMPTGASETPAAATIYWRVSR